MCNFDFACCGSRTWFNLEVDGLCLQLLLGYLPPDRALWPSEVAKKRSQFKHFKDELLMNPVSNVIVAPLLYLSNAI